METPKKNKKVAGAFFKGLFRGLTRLLPFGLGNIALEIGDAIAGNKMPDKKLIDDPNLTLEDAIAIDKFRRYCQIVFQIAGSILVIYAFFTKQINIGQLLEYLNPETVPVIK